MLKKMSAALILASLLAAPAMAAGIEKTAPAPIAKPVASTPVKSEAKPEARLQVKPAVLNANARMGRHHHRHVRHHHRFHRHG
jgi:hypothetical protein